MTARPGYIRALLIDSLAVVGIFAMSALPLLAQERPICYVTTGEGCDWVEAVSALPHDLIEFALDGTQTVLRTLPDQPACRAARAAAAAGASLGTDNSCRTR